MPSYKKVRKGFDQAALKRVCEMDELDFEGHYGLERVEVVQEAPDDFYLFQNNGSNILAVAHLDTVGQAHQREANFLETQGGTVIYSRALDDRLGAYTILEWLPALGIQFDILLTVGEESGRSTAGFFEPPEGKKYNWMIEFDRGGTDVVMYQYDERMYREMVREAGARIDDYGIFSDICELEHLECKGFNWGIGYRDYHGPRAHAYLEDTFQMVNAFLKFHKTWADIPFPHDDESWRSVSNLRRHSYSWLDSDNFDIDEQFDGDGLWVGDSGRVEPLKVAASDDPLDGIDDGMVADVIEALASMPPNEVGEVVIEVESVESA